MLEGFEDKRQHADALGVSTRTIDRYLDKTPGLPHMRLAGRLYFKREWTAAWLESQRVQRNVSPPRRRPTAAPAGA